MSDPIVFISHSRVKEGKLDAFRELSEEVFSAIETTGFEIYGTPNKETLAMLRQAPGVEVEVNPDGFGGYIRLGES